MISPCFTQLQLINNFILTLSQQHKLNSKQTINTPSIIVIQINNESSKLTIKIMQIELIIKISITNHQIINDSFWINTKNHINKKLSNQYTLKSLKNNRLQSTIVQRIFNKLSKKKDSLLQKVLYDPLLLITILKYIQYRTGQQVLLLNHSIHKIYHNNETYKTIYEARFGKTGFGLNLDWRKNYIKKIKQKQSIY